MSGPGGMGGSQYQRPMGGGYGLGGGAQYGRPPMGNPMGGNKMGMLQQRPSAFGADPMQSMPGRGTYANPPPPPTQYTPYGPQPDGSFLPPPFVVDEPRVYQQGPTPGPNLFPGTTTAPIIGGAGSRNQGAPNQDNWPGGVPPGGSQGAFRPPGFSSGPAPSYMQQQPQTGGQNIQPPPQAPTFMQQQPQQAQSGLPGNDLLNSEDPNVRRQAMDQSFNYFRGQGMNPQQIMAAQRQFLDRTPNPANGNVAPLGISSAWGRG